MLILSSFVGLTPGLLVCAGIFHWLSTLSKSRMREKENLKPGQTLRNLRYLPSFQLDPFQLIFIVETLIEFLAPQDLPPAACSLTKTMVCSYAKFTFYDNQRSDYFLQRSMLIFWKNLVIWLTLGPALRDNSGLSTGSGGPIVSGYQFEYGNCFLQH